MKKFEILPITGGINAPKGFYANGISAGLKGLDENNEPKLDVAFIYMDPPCIPHAIFTSNKFQAAPIKHFKKYAQNRPSNFVLINTKNANALTGEKGIEDIEEILSALERDFPQITHPIMCSTGVIGVRLPKQKIITSFSKIDFTHQENTAHTKAAQAIMTTDRFHKEIALKVELADGGMFHIGAMAKGAGMIDPSLATMLCFITTDACVPENEAKNILQECAFTTFNAISVDGDTSTNDTIMLFANSQSKAYERSAFKEALKMVMHKLATDIVSDGEGSSKLVAFEVSGAKDKAEAIKAAKALSNSLLVKTAIFGCDPNWGRIASTIGACGVSASEESLKIFIGDILVYDRGEILFDTQTEKKAALVMEQDAFAIRCDLGIADGKFRAYGCDLGHRYVEINSDYRS
ncbi:bifunctional glutamate N-acetyltransferase/amino-acid acetyltransferase ArgJ [Helicobacter sp. 11S02596-1]|uniref:bifunctional glutamate N-acetyltransferase/amino-acid acetyltransferase ArgJ n=1 Tax=Helicobacter sp. 11S02596-1 TaxID=1476194 RepID=UPI000BA745F0|nr:bifunctional glutamate N-acetyltransferase/amino-acid acetyltransferase ArgJ [Helicobacter sp. 11S02596-1]PAF44306.1 bifunctional ornithine acetyltransferase/N-acetylglutamate synthase [Helicobacter sp. 11S02596-1]